MANQELTSHITQQRVNYLLRHYHLGIPFTLVLAISWQWYLQPGLFTYPTRLYWLASILIFSITSCLLFYFIKNNRNDAVHAMQTEYLFSATGLILGTLWAGGLLFFLKGAAYTELLVGLTLCFIMVLHCFIVTLTSPLTFSAFALPLLIAAVNILAQLSQLPNLQLYCIFSLIFGALFFIYRDCYHYLCQQVEHRIRKTILADSLSQITSELESMSHADPLTDIANRRYFDELLDIHWQHAIRQKSAIALLYLDIDFFKQFNDSQGHQQGDEVLRQVAHCCEKIARRSNDVAARYGGEEFLIMLYECSQTQAIERAEQLRATIANMAIPHPASAVTEVLTVSIGVAHVFPQTQSGIKHLFHCADMALYEAKKRGRNQIFYWQADVLQSPIQTVGD